MNIEAYNLDSLRKLVRALQAENKELRELQQNLSAQRLLSYENGILSAATAFGKTVVCSYLIAQTGIVDIAMNTLHWKGTRHRESIIWLYHDITCVRYVRK